MANKRRRRIIIWIIIGVVILGTGIFFGVRALIRSSERAYQRQLQQFLDTGEEIPTDADTQEAEDTGTPPPKPKKVGSLDEACRAIGNKAYDKMTGWVSSEDLAYLEALCKVMLRQSDERVKCIVNAFGEPHGIGLVKRMNMVRLSSNSLIGISPITLKAFNDKMKELKLK